MLTKSFVVSAIRAEAADKVAIELSVPGEPQMPRSFGLTMNGLTQAEAAEFAVHQDVTLTLGPRVA